MEIVQLALVRPCADWLPGTLLEFALGKALHLSKSLSPCSVSHKSKETLPQAGKIGEA